MGGFTFCILATAEFIFHHTGQPIVEAGPVLYHSGIYRLDTSLAMSTEDPDRDNDGRSSRPPSTEYQAKLAVHERDRYICINCRESFDDGSHLDVDHVIARGDGGSNTLRNKASECRRCHEAKHSERDHAPTIRFASTGDMIDQDFTWFRHFWTSILPAMSEAAAGHRVTPVFDIADSAGYRAWHIPLGDVRRLDEILADMDDIGYTPMGVHHYMG